jgi:hypothetical protein
MVVGMAETGKLYDENLHKKTEGRSTRTLWQSPPRGNHPLQMERLPLMDRTSPRKVGRYSKHVAV